MMYYKANMIALLLGIFTLISFDHTNKEVGIGTRVSRIGLAESSDGFTMKKRDTPVIFPGDDNNKRYEWPGGCEDPRVAVTDEGTYLLFYISWDRETARLCVATSADLINREKRGPVFAKAYCAGQALFDKNDPALLIKRLDQPFLFPEEDFEKNGQYPGGTVFIEGLVYFQKKWFLYYGCADSKVAVAVYE